MLVLILGTKSKIEVKIPVKWKESENKHNKLLT